MENWVKRSFENVYANMALYELTNIKDSIEKKLFFMADLEIGYFLNWFEKCNIEDRLVLEQLYSEEIESLL